MKKSRRLSFILVGASLLAFTILTGPAFGQDRGETKVTIGSANVSIDYGRPQLKGRDPLKMIQPGGIWRIGSNAPTTITSDVDLDFGGTRVPKGKHILLARLAEPGKWSLVVSAKDAFQYEPSAKLAEVPMELKEEKEPVEALTINLSLGDHNKRGVIEVTWGKLRLLAFFTPAK
ncbi:MAG: DUF2911 domain-containing protein [Terriglobia bacterium]